MPINSHKPTLRSAAASLAVAALATIGGVAAESTAAVPWNCPISGSGISRGRTNKLQKLEILVNGDPLDALAAIVHEKDAFHKGQRLITKLKDLIPRQLYDVAIQAASGGRIISRANVKATRKDVLAKCYGGDISRKKKLLEKQKKGKKRLKMVGNVEIPQDAFMAVLKLDDD